MSDLSSTLSTTLGSAYRIERELGGGGMSRVFLAEETALGRRVVIKVLPPDTAASVNAERFRREIQMAAQLQHPAIVPLLSAGASGELLWFVMPFVDGASLRAKISKAGQLPLDEAVRAWRDLLEALEYADSQNVVHRDIKPENIMLSGRHAVVLDFGVAKAVSASTGVVGAGMTGLGMAIGTPAYMAPEQIAAEANADGRIDLYAAGLVMYEMLAGRGPFDGASPSEMMAAHIAKAPAPLGEQRPGLPAALEQLVMQCLEKNPAARPRSAADVLHALDAMSGEILGARTPSGTPSPTSTLGGVTGSVAPTMQTRGRGNRRAVLIGGAALLAIVIGVGTAMVRAKVADTKARLGVGVADSSRLGVMFFPVLHDPADSVLARNLGGALLTAAQSDRRLLPFGEERSQTIALEFGSEPGTVTKDTLTALARDMGLRTVVTASVARIGTGFLLSVEGRALANDSSLFRVEVTASDVSALPKAIQSMAERSRAGLAAAFGHVGRPTASGTLLGTSPAAAQLWTQAAGLMGEGNFPLAAQKARESIALDSGFAPAWTLLGIILENEGLHPHERFVAYRQSYLLTERKPSKYVRSMVQSPYLQEIGNYREAVAVLEAGAQKTTGEGFSQTDNELGLAYRQLRRHDLALGYFAKNRDSSTATPGGGESAYHSSLMEIGRSADALREQQRYEAAAGASDNTVGLMKQRYWTAMRVPDSAAYLATQRLGRARTEAGRLGPATTLRVALATMGRLDSAAVIDSLRRGVWRVESDTTALLLSAANVALERAEFLGDVRAGASLDAVLRDGRLNALLPLDRPYPAIVRALAATGRIADAQRVLDDWGTSVPPDLRRVQGWAISTARGEVLLAEKKGAAALAAFRAGDSTNCVACAWPNYARAYDMMGMRDSAVSWYERYLSSSSVLLANSAHSRFLAQAYRRLGELHEEAGNVPQAIQRYGDFVELWKNADPALQPAVKSARERIARLQAKRN